MKLSKACFNENCAQSSVKKKKKYKKPAEQYCPFCGEALVPVCRQSKCHEILSADSGEAYCPEHLEIKREKDKKKFELLRKVSVAAAIVGVSAKIIYDGLGVDRKK